MDDLETLATVLAAPEMSHDAIDRGRDRLRRRMHGPFRRRRAVWLAAGLGAAAAATAAVVVVAQGPAVPPLAVSPGPTSTASLSGRQILLAAADTAERAPAGSGTYWYVKTVTSDGKPTTWETWTRRDGRTWFRGEKTQGKVVDWTAGPPFWLGGSSVGFTQLRKLPTRPGALTAWIEDSVRHSDVRTSAGRPDAAVRKLLVMDGLVSLVSQLPAPPKVRAAAFRAIAASPGVRSLGKVEGGQGLLLPSAGGEQARLVVDPASGQVRDTNYYVTADGGEAWIPGGATITTDWTDTLPS